LVIPVHSFDGRVHAIITVSIRFIHIATSIATTFLIQLPSYRPKLWLFISDPSDRHTLFGRVPLLHRSSTTSTFLLGSFQYDLSQRYEPIYQRHSTGRVFSVWRNTKKLIYGSAHIVIPCLTASCTCKRYKAKAPSSRTGHNGGFSEPLIFRGTCDPLSKTLTTLSQ